MCARLKRGVRRGCAECVSVSGAFAMISCHEMNRRPGSSRTPSSMDAMQSQIISSCANCLHAPARALPEQGAVSLNEALLLQQLLALCVKLIDQRHVAAIRKLPLLRRAIDVAAIVIQMAEPLLKACLRIPAEEGVQEVGAKIAITVEELEQLDIALSQFNALSRADAAHAGAAFRCLHALSKYIEPKSSDTVPMWG